MSEPENIAASVRDRLRNLAKKQQEDFQVLLQRYAIERLLYRVSKSEYRDSFVLKGAMVFLAWGNGPRRSTRDLDLMGYGDNSVTRLEEVFRKICKVPVEPDGLEFKAETVRGAAINETHKYMGVRIKLRTFLVGSNTRNDIQVDIGYGNPITPNARTAEFPTLLNLPKPQIKAYPPETVIAEKFHAIVKQGIENTRLKDFYDLEAISQRLTFQGDTLGRAIETTFKSRGELLPKEVPVGLTPRFTEDREKLRLWRQFHTSARILEDPKPLSEVGQNLQRFLMPVCLAIGSGRILNQQWSPDGLDWNEQLPDLADSPTRPQNPIQ